MWLDTSFIVVTVFVNNWTNVAQTGSSSLLLLRWKPLLHKSVTDRVPCDVENGSSISLHEIDF